MALEDQQKTIHLVMSTKATTEGLDQRDAQSQGDANSVNFVRQVAQLVKENSEYTECRSGVGMPAEYVANENSVDFLQQRQAVSISSDNQTKYTSRLVGQFLLSFWLPSV